MSTLLMLVAREKNSIPGLIGQLFSAIRTIPERATAGRLRSESEGFLGQLSPKDFLASSAAKLDLEASAAVNLLGLWPTPCRL
jgi:hypothetical protein